MKSANPLSITESGAVDPLTGFASNMFTANPLSIIESEAVDRLTGFASTSYMPNIFVSADGLFVEYITPGDDDQCRVQNRIIFVDQIARTLNSPDAEIIRGILRRLHIWNSRLGDVYEADKARRTARKALESLCLETDQ